MAGDLMAIIILFIYLKGIFLLSQDVLLGEISRR